MLVRNGKLCKRCGTECLEKICESDPVLVECPLCSGYGCEHCDDGDFRLTECARKYIKPIMRAANIGWTSEKGFLPMAGGLLDQSAWFLEMMNALTNDQNKLDAEAMERKG